MSDLETIMLKTVKEVELKDKDVLARVDFNVPIGKPDGMGAIEDDTRIRAALPTIKYILDSGARRLVLMTHVDPWDEISPTTKDLRLKTDKIATRLSDLLGMPVTKADDCIDVDLPETGIIMLENLRFHKEEKKDDAVFAKKIADLLPVENRVYVNDAFGTCHRAHASIHAIVQYFEEACAGLLLAKEAKYLGPVAKNPKQPFYAILGGSKVADKIQTIENLARKAKKLFIGGKMALAFAKAYGIDPAEIGAAEKLLAAYGSKLVLPVDYKTEKGDIVPANNLPQGAQLWDLGPETLKQWTAGIEDAATIFGNLVVGYIEKQGFDYATNGLIVAMANSKATTIIGGGDSVKAVNKLIKKGIIKEGSIDHISTGGGASMELLEGKELPGLKVLGFYS
jgi:phosphoglycerate kinase